MTRAPEAAHALVDRFCEVGFYLRGSGIGRLFLPKVAGGGLTTGKTQDYPITLKEGSYVYSCPLNPTPDYRLIVKP